MTGGRPDFVGGNTRLRARIPALRQLADLSPARDREQTARQLLRAVPGAYSQGAAAVVGVLLARQDLSDVVALLRGAVHGHPAAMRRRGVRAVGRVSQPAAQEVAEAANGAEAALRLTAHRLPEPDLTGAVHAAWGSYELHEDLHELETAIATAAHLAWQRRLAHAGPRARAVLGLLLAERDLANLRTVLRVGSLDRVGLLPYGRLGASELAAAVRGDWAPLSRARPDWASTLPRRGPRPSATVLELALHDLIAQQARPLLRFGDVYTAEPAVGYVLTVENTALGTAAGRQGAAPHPATTTGTGTGSRPAEQESSWATSS